MSTMRARSLPRVREALEKAERARFYKQRTNKYTDEIRLTNALTGLENQRIAALARIKEETLDLRMQALQIRDEEKAALEADTAGLQELAQKVELSKQRNFLQEAKYKPKRAREQFVQRFERWKTEDAAEEDWRLRPPPREPQIQLDEHLIYPAKRERKQNRRLYREITRRPDSQLGEKAVGRLRDLYTDGRTQADRRFFEELESEFSTARTEPAGGARHEEASPFVTQQLSLVRAVQERSLERILNQIEETRQAIRFWEVPASDPTKLRLGDCSQKRRFRVRRFKPKPQLPGVAEGKDGEDSDGPNDDEEEEEDGETTGTAPDSEVRFRRASWRRMAEAGTAEAASAAEAEAAEAADGEEVDDAEARGAGRRMSKRLSRDFNRRRQSLLRELEEGDATPEERQRRMREFQLSWTEVLKCKYIRGYEPPDMRLPEGQSATDFVFGEAQARVLDRIAEEAAATAAGKAEKLLLPAVQ